MMTVTFPLNHEGREFGCCRSETGVHFGVLVLVAVDQRTSIPLAEGFSSNCATSCVFGVDFRRR